MAHRVPGTIKTHLIMKFQNRHDRKKILKGAETAHIQKISFRISLDFWKRNIKMI